MLAPFLKLVWEKHRLCIPQAVCFCLEGSAKEAGVSEAEAAVTGGPTRRNAANQTSVLLTKQQALFIDVALCH